MQRNLSARRAVIGVMAALQSPPPALSPAFMAGLPDATLVRLVAAGSDDAFAALDERYRRRLVRFARGFVAGSADAEDAVQDAMVRALRALRSGRSEPEAVGPWLHRIARNCALDLTAARRRHPVTELGEHQHPVAEDAQAAVERRQGVRGLVEDVGALPDTQRSALVLRELEGRSYTDIADELDVTVPAVKSLLVRARAGLKRAREERRGALAGWLPLPLFTRLAERLTAVWEPMTASATPKLACAAVVVAGSIPVVASPDPPPARADHGAAPAALRAEATPTPPPTPQGHGGAGVGAVSDRAAADALRADCADGTIDSQPSRATLLGALRATATSGHEYSDCRDALQAALLRSR